MLLAVGLLLGQAKLVALAPFSLASLLAWSYLIVFGSIVAFGAFTWLLKVTSPAVVSTYAYVNPVVAVILGWSLGGDTINLRTIVSAVMMIAAVALITTYQRAGQQRGYQRTGQQQAALD